MRIKKKNRQKLKNSDVPTKEAPLTQYSNSGWNLNSCTEKEPENTRETKNSNPEFHLRLLDSELVSRSLERNNYEENYYIGQGGFGVVYKGTEKASKADLVIKKLFLEDEDEERVEFKLKSLVSEISIHKSLSHPNIVKYVNGTRFGNEVWILLEYMSQGSLYDLIKKVSAPLPEKRIAGLCKGILMGLHYLHSRLVIHRDIKSHNILLGEKDCVKISDFGLSVQLRSEAPKVRELTGTSRWMAPEVVSNEYYGTAVDIWSLGITIFECLEGVPPYSHLNTDVALSIIARKTKPALRSDSSQTISFELTDFVSQCLEVNDWYRASASDLLSHSFLNVLSVISF